MEASPARVIFVARTIPDIPVPFSGFLPYFFDVVDAP
jgi:hypothetical protein